MLTGDNPGHTREGHSKELSTQPFLTTQALRLSLLALRHSLREHKSRT